MPMATTFNCLHLLLLHPFLNADQTVTIDAAQDVEEAAREALENLLSNVIEINLQHILS